MFNDDDARIFMRDGYLKNVSESLV
jgi:hypothetical protein